MNHSNSNNRDPIFDFFDDYEIRVAQIILQLPHLIFQSDPPLRFPFSWSWGAKKKRSAAIDLTLFPPPPSGPSLRPPPSHGDTPTLKVKASSPKTPLSFSPSESDAKSKHSKRRTSNKRTRDEFLGILAELSRCKDLLQGEVDNVKLHYDKLKAFNFELKARERELSLSLKQEESSLNFIRRLDLVMEPTVHFNGEEEQQQIPIVIHQPPSDIHQTIYSSEILENSHGQMSSSLSSGVNFGNAKHLSILRIPDLNFSVEESVGMDYFPLFDQNRAAIAAQARKRRIEINRGKNNSMATLKPRGR